jgi:histidyl-tRNA synthetase
MHRFHVAGKSAEIYPSPAKISKQFEYADKKGTTYCVLYGKAELEKREFVLKNLRT